MGVDACCVAGLGVYDFEALLAAGPAQHHWQGWLASSLDHCELYDCAIAADDGLVGFPALEAHHFDSSVLGAEEDEGGVDGRCDERADHGVVLDDALQEHCLNCPSSPHDLPYVETVVQPAGDCPCSIATNDYLAHCDLIGCEGEG